MASKAMLEEPLTGGHMNCVVRVGDTVRRSAGPASATVQRLLRHVRERGVSWVPAPLGHDEQGREVLSYIPGEVPHDMPGWIWSNSVLDEVAAALRQWHDASVDFDRAGATWDLGGNPHGEVICHNDFAPYNCVFEHGRFVGAFDFDLCSPGTRLWDLVYTAYRFVPLMPPRHAHVADGDRERSPFEVEVTRARLSAFLDRYAVGAPWLRFGHDAVADVAKRRLRAIAAWTTRYVAESGKTALAPHAEMYRAHAAWIDGDLRAALP